MHRTPLLLALFAALLLTGCGGDGAASTQETPTAAQDAPPATSRPAPAGDGQPTILVLGNSIAAGYGLNKEQAFPALLQTKIDSLGWRMNVVNAGLSGETTAGGLRRLDWLLRQPVDVLVVELGGNDGLRGTPVETTRQNLAAIIEKARAKYPDVRVILTGMQVPPNLGAQYTQDFKALYPALADAKDVRLVPFLLEGVGGRPALNQPDGIHPTAEGQRLVARNVWDVLRPTLRDLQEAQSQPSS